VCVCVRPAVRRGAIDGDFGPPTPLPIERRALPVVTRLAATLPVLERPVTASAERHDVVSDSAGRWQFFRTFDVDLAERIAMKDELAPFLVATAVTSTRCGTAISIELATWILIRMLFTDTTFAGNAASWMPADPEGGARHFICRPVFRPTCHRRIFCPDRCRNLCSICLRR
jgi:hypothetical protein